MVKSRWMMKVNFGIGERLNHSFLYRFRIKALRRVWQRIDLIKRETWELVERVLEFKRSFAKDAREMSSKATITLTSARKNVEIDELIEGLEVLEIDSRKSS